MAAYPSEIGQYIEEEPSHLYSGGNTGDGLKDNFTTFPVARSATFFSNASSSRSTSHAKEVDAPIDSETLMTATKFFPFSELMESWLYGAEGYYMRNAKLGVDFNTNATRADGMGLSFLVVCRAYAYWKSAGEPDEFNLLEGGAGNGALSFGILSILKSLAEANEDYRNFYSAIKYHIAEISPGLAKEQADKNKVFIDEDKLKIVQVDITSHQECVKVDFFLTNELLDAFPLEAVKTAEDGTLLTQLVAVSISIESFRRIFGEECLENQRVLTNHFNNMSTSTINISTSVVLDKDQFTGLSQHNKKLCSWTTCWVPVGLFKELNDFFVGPFGRLYTETLTKGNVGFINPKLVDFMRFVSKNLRGIILTLDYAQLTGDKKAFCSDNSHMLIPVDGKFGYHDVLSEVSPSQFGKIDLTQDVDLKLLSHIGALLGITTLSAGHQSHLIYAMSNVAYKEIAKEIAKIPKKAQRILTGLKLFTIMGKHFCYLEQASSGASKDIIKKYLKMICSTHPDVVECEKKVLPNANLHAGQIIAETSLDLFGGGR